MLLLKLMIVPVLVALMSLAARRFGPRIGGLLIGLPWMTGPIIFFLGQQKGDLHASRLAVGAMLATISISAYALTYGRMGRHFSWPVSLTTGVLAYGCTGWLLSGLTLAPAAAALIGGSCLIAASVLIPPPRTQPPRRVLPWWDIPVRMLAAAVLVIVIALISDQLGATSAGLVASFPVLLTVIGTFTHHQWGADALLALLRGIAQSLLSFVMFFWIVAVSAVPLGLPLSYTVATVGALCVSALLVAFNQFRAVRARAAQTRAASALSKMACRPAR
jgi:hypothetical protein